MRLTIEYCETCNYRPIAASLLFIVKQAFDIDVTLVSSKGQVFDVYLDDNLIFSKKDTGRFPMHDEIIEKIRKIKE